ncbi:NIPSNAP family protein [Marinivivus vitaminiproducens]|uniref:NIPSNAP family protein n=1 Tax=Marinivivus vitaminiproducens TaxID=3035935 RepID=UPI0027A0F76A|nr:NIPSNAP family protein [Geminicoccaceae bacterium SCSIO 64248]
MLYDHRTYTVKPGTLARQLALYGEHGYPVQLRHLGKPVFYGVTETGPLNSYVHIWAYDGAADREAKRAAMAADPDWQAYLAMSNEAGNIIDQTNRLMSDAPFFTP